MGNEGTTGTGSNTTNVVTSSIKTQNVRRGVAICWTKTETKTATSALFAVHPTVCYAYGPSTNAAEYSPSGLMWSVARL